MLFIWAGTGNENYPKAPRAEEWEFSAISLRQTWKGDFSGSNDLGFHCLFLVQSASALSHSNMSFSSKAMLSG